jgi:hypothetical protein
MRAEPLEVSANRIGAECGDRAGQGLCFDEFDRRVAQRHGFIDVTLVAGSHPRLGDLESTRPIHDEAMTVKR